LITRLCSNRLSMKKFEHHILSNSTMDDVIQVY